MNTINGPFAVVAEQIIAVNPVQVPDTPSFQFGINFTQCCVRQIISLGEIKKSGAGRRMTLYDYDRSIRVGPAKNINEWFGPLVYLRFIHVWNTIQDIDSRVQLGQQISHLRLHACTTRKTEIDNGPIEMPADYSWVGHPCPPHATALSDGRTVKANRFLSSFRYLANLPEAGYANEY